MSEIEIERDWEKAWDNLEVDDLEEIYACMEHSDRYIHEGRKMRIMASMIQEIEKRNSEGVAK